jgi:hypothetical protein
MNIFNIPILKPSTIFRQNNLPNYHQLWQQSRHDKKFELPEEIKLILQAHTEKIKLLNRNLDRYSLKRIMNLGINLSVLCDEAGVEYWLITQRFHRGQDINNGDINKFKVVISKYLGE